MTIRRLSQHSLILLANNLATAVLAFGLTLLIARGMGDTTLGRYAGIMAWVLPLTQLVDAGLSSLLTRNIAQHPDLTSSYLHEALRLRLGLGGMVIVLVLLFSTWLSPSPDGLRIAIFLVLLDNLFGTYTAVFRAWGRMTPILVLNGIYLGLQVVWAGIVVWQEWGLNALLTGIVVADGIQLALTWGYWRFSLPHDSDTIYRVPTGIGQERSISAELVGGEYTPPAPEHLIHAGDRINLLRQSFPFMVAGLLATLQIRGVILLLEQLESPQVVGWYAAASRTIEALRMPPSALFGALFPALAGLIEQPHAYRQVMRLAFMGLLLYGVFSIALAVGLGAWLIPFLFGAEFRPASPVFVILSLALALGLVRGLLSLDYYAHHRERAVNWAMAIAFIVQFIAGYLLIRAYHLRGAGWMLVIGEGVLVALLWWRRL